jgi:hypothetical protein
MGGHVGLAAAMSVFSAANAEPQSTNTARRLVNTVRNMVSPPKNKEGVLDVSTGRVNRKEKRSRGDERKRRNAVSVSWRGARLYGNTASALDFC